MLGEPLFMSTVFIAGFLSFFAPCTFPLIPVYIGLLTDKEGQSRWRPMGKTILFVGGLSTSFLILGFGAGALGSLISGRAFMVVAGGLVMILGFHQMGLFRLEVLSKYRVMSFKERQGGYLGSYLLGIGFSFGWTPCVGPILGAVLVLSASGGQPLYGVWMMLVYALGLAVPFLIMALLSNLLLDRFEKLEKHTPMIKKVGGVMIVLMGILLMTENMMVFTRFFENLF
jgi:cytochrome c-type biogenesis protein